MSDLDDVTASGWAKVVTSFDHQRDIILFPGGDSINIQDLTWPGVDSVDSEGGDVHDSKADEDGGLTDQLESLHIESSNTSPPSSLNTKSPPAPFRLIMIESTWGGAKTIVNYIHLVRSMLHLPPLRCVALPESVNGLYWKLQHVGSSAVSTIEALSHAAKAAGCASAEAEKLLTLFYLQRYRLMNRVKSDGRPPRAVDVRGPWKVYKDKHKEDTNH
jgi:hypothetical protein